MNLKNKLFLNTLVVIAVITIFGTGFYVGSSKGGYFSVSASEAPADLTPYWKVWNLLNTKYAPSGDEVVTSQDRVWGSIKGMVNSLNDPYTVFLSPEEKVDFDLGISGEFSGVGMEVGIQDDVLTVVAPLKDTPAFNAGVKSGDIILKIDETSTNNLSIDEAISLMRGEKGTPVTLTLYREGASEPLVLTIVRDIIAIPTIDTEIKDGVFIISLYNFNAQSTDLFREAMKEFYNSGKKKLILDLRGNPGGFLDAAIDISSWFLPAGKVVVKESFADGDEQVFRSKGYDIIGKRSAKVIVLIDGGSASASEIVAGALQEQGIAKLVGEQTFGKGSVQELIDITEDTALKVTIARWLTPNGTSISENGLTPDYEVMLESSEIDAQMEKAFELLK